MPPAVKEELVVIKLAVFENTHAGTFLPRPHGGPLLPNSQVADLRGRPGSSLILMTEPFTATAARLRFQKSVDIRELVSDRRAVDSAKRAADVQSPFPLQYLHAATANGGIHVLIDPGPWDRRHIREIDEPAHIATAR